MKLYSQQQILELLRELEKRGLLMLGPYSIDEIKLPEPYEPISEASLNEMRSSLYSLYIDKLHDESIY